MQAAKILSYDQIPFMHWGIITRHNFSEDKIKYVPRKRWDPLSSAEIKLYDTSTGRLIPIGKRRGHFSYVSPIRAARPEDIRKAREKKRRDVFKSIIEGKDYAIFVTLDDKRADSAFSTTPVMIELKDVKAVTIINRFPAMARYIDEEVLGKIKPRVEDPHTKIAYGINLVSFVVDEFYGTLSDARVDRLKCMLRSMISAIEFSVKDAMDRGIKLIPVYSFFNIGYMAGGSQPRLHSQVYIDLNQDGHGAFMENLLQAFEDKRVHGYCYLCTSRHDGRVVYENTTWTAWATSSPRRNFHLRLSPKRHVDRITDFDSTEVEGLADALIVLSRALDEVGVVPDRNVLIYSNPYGYDSFFHVFVDIIPFERIGGIEMLDSVRVARYSPEDVAQEVRRAVEEVLSSERPL